MEEANFELYEFNVQIWKDEERKWSFGICQEFESEGSDDFEPLESGQADTLEDAAHLAGDAIRRVFPA